MEKADQTVSSPHGTVTINIYLIYPYDAALLALLDCEEISLPYITKKALKYFTMGKRLFIQTPTIKTSHTGAERGTYSITLSTTEDRETINFLRLVKQEYRSSFIKEIVKCSLDFPHVEYFIRKDAPQAMQAIEFIEQTRNTKNLYVCPLQKKPFTNEYMTFEADDISVEAYDAQDATNVVTYDDSKHRELEKLTGEEKIQRYVNDIFEKANQERLRRSV